MNPFIPFENQELAANIRTVVDNGVTLFVGQDVCSNLAIKDYRGALNRLDSDEVVRFLKPNTEQRRGYSVPATDGNQGHLCVTESGLYALILQSRKPEARKFCKWVTNVVLPALRRGELVHVHSPQRLTADDLAFCKLLADANAGRDEAEIIYRVEDLATLAMDHNLYQDILNSKTVKRGGLTEEAHHVFHLRLTWIAMLGNQLRIYETERRYYRFRDTPLINKPAWLTEREKLAAPSADSQGIE